MNLNDGVTAWIRSTVPIYVGALATWLAKHWGVHIDSIGAAAFLTGTAGSLYYAIVSALERWEPAFGILLGTSKGPATYPDSTAAPAPTAPTVKVQLKDLLPAGTEIKVPDAPPAAPAPTSFTFELGADGKWGFAPTVVHTSAPVPTPTEPAP